MLLSVNNRAFSLWLWKSAHAASSR